MAFDDELDILVEQCESTFGMPITLTAVTPGTMNHTTGTRADSETSQSINANRMPIERAPFALGEGRGMRERRVYWVRAASVTVGGGIPRAGWKITDSDSSVLAVTEVHPDVDRKGFYIVAGKAA